MLWLPEVNWKTTVSPPFAVTELGVKAGFSPAKTYHMLNTILRDDSSEHSQCTSQQLHLPSFLEMLSEYLYQY